MRLATVLAEERGETDRLLNCVVPRLQESGTRVVGALRADAPQGECDCALTLLPGGPVVRITQDLGAGSTACRMDAGALEEAVGIASARLETNGADLVVINKFGLSETEGRGFRALIAEAMGRDIPVLVGLSAAHREGFLRFAGELAEPLAPTEAAIFEWCLAAVGARMDRAAGGRHSQLEDETQ
ncbi:DUF2478 domain-containing protein [Marivita sp. GX14005]|uniref:DUF2478 domain-containing protein n=1 Tax=Marivita sp. GX14005 TaxID=2942276 RepID=UPI00201A134A|nr:DUF2478 domain-containing protein [Marivita sp. GX14005]MCL3882550.1 DUF2478 domain-containing protein [Marivita sp. GX14005]